MYNRKYYLIRKVKALARCKVLSKKKLIIIPINKKITVKGMRYIVKLQQEFQFVRQMSIPVPVQLFKKKTNQ